MKSIDQVLNEMQLPEGDGETWNPKKSLAQLLKEDEKGKKGKK